MEEFDYLTIKEVRDLLEDKFLHYQKLAKENPDDEAIGEMELFYEWGIEKVEALEDYVAMARKEKK